MPASFSEESLKAVDNLLDDFARCERADGSFYGTGGTCRKGTPAPAITHTVHVNMAKGVKKSDIDAILNWYGGKVTGETERGIIVGFKDEKSANTFQKNLKFKTPMKGSWADPVYPA
jgi:hypothetical protein